MNSSATNTANRMKNHAGKHAGEWVETYARIGIAAKGVVYVMVGVLAAMTIFGGTNGENNGKQGALQTIIEQPFGKILLGIVVAGLLGYVAWRMIQAFSDPDGYGSDTKGIGKRIGFFISGLIYLFFAFSGVRLLFPSLSSSGGGSSSSGGSGRQLLVAKALEQPFGQWLVGIAAALIIGKGIFQFYRAFSGKFRKRIKEEEMSSKEQQTFIKAGKVGYIARGITLGIVGYFMVQAALKANPGEAQGTEGALDFLSMAGGPYLMAAVAIGLACYGIFMFVMARYRYMPNIGS